MKLGSRKETDRLSRVVAGGNRANFKSVDYIFNHALLLSSIILRGAGRGRDQTSINKNDCVAHMFF